MDRSARVGTQRRWAAALLVAGVLAGFAAAAPATAAADDCALIGAGDLERVLHIPYEAQTGVEPSCLFLSAKGARSSIVTAFGEERSATAIAEGKRQMRAASGARVLKGIGDLAILTTEPKADPTGDETLGLAVFDGNEFASIGITIAGRTPTTKEMRRLGKILAANL
jgi:hypothetical protein